MHKTFKIGVAAMLGSSLSGCIAAAAVPVLAGTGILGSRVIEEGSTDKVAEATIPRPPFDRPAETGAEVQMASPTETPRPVEIEPRSAAQSATTANSGLIDPTIIETAQAAELAPAATPTPPRIAAFPLPSMFPPDVALSNPIPFGVASLSTETSAVSPTAPPAPSLATASTTTRSVVPPVRLTLPDGRQIAVSGDDAGQQEIDQNLGQTPDVPSAIGASPYSRLYEFALAKSAPTGRSERRNSALLAAPGALLPNTSRCGTTQPAIVIDLDPGEGLLDPTARFAPNPALAQALASLRERNVSVHWISGNSAAFAGALRSRLAEAGLDPEGKDELVLMRNRGDRKQILRRAIGATHCLIAIAGGERSDFDELYDYLKNPDAAIALEALVGQGWFLIPPALVNKDEN